MRAYFFVSTMKKLATLLFAANMMTSTPVFAWQDANVSSEHTVYDFDNYLHVLARKDDVKMVGNDLQLLERHPFSSVFLGALITVGFTVGIGAVLQRDDTKAVAPVLGVGVLCSLIYTGYKYNRWMYPPMICQISRQGITANSVFTAWADIVSCDIQEEKQQSGNVITGYTAQNGVSGAYMTAPTVAKRESLSLYGKQGALLLQVSSDDLPITMREFKGLVDYFVKHGPHVK